MLERQVVGQAAIEREAPALVGAEEVDLPRGEEAARQEACDEHERDQRLDGEAALALRLGGLAAARRRPDAAPPRLARRAALGLGAHGARR